MALRYLPVRFLQSARPCVRSIASTSRLLSKDRQHENVDQHRQFQKEKPLTPHMTNTTSTIANESPNLGTDKPPPDLVTAVDPEYVPQDKVPENTERMTGATQEPNPGQRSDPELGVGEMEGAAFKVEPMRRTGETDDTMRARLLCPSGTGRERFIRS